MKAYKILLFLLVFIPSFASAQCKPFTKNKVLPKLNGYVQNDSYNSAQMAPGEEAEIMVTFFGGRDYRLLVVAHLSLVMLNSQLVTSTENRSTPTKMHKTKRHLNSKWKTRNSL